MSEARMAFENQYDSDYLGRDDAGYYKLMSTQEEWELWDSAWQAARACQESEPIGFLQSSGVSQLSGGHPAKLYPIGATPSPFESSTLLYTNPASRQDFEGEAIGYVVPRMLEAMQAGKYCGISISDEQKAGDIAVYTHPASAEVERLQARVAELESDEQEMAGDNNV